MRASKLPLFRTILAALTAALACSDPQKKTDSNANQLPALRADSAVIDGAAPSCNSCSLALVDSLQLGTPDDAEIPQRVPGLLRDSRGNHYMTFHGWGDKPILRYDSSGRFIGRLGASGQGPGEYTTTFTAFVGPADSMFVFGDDRLQLFTHDNRYVRAVTLPRAHPLGVTRDGIIVADGSKPPRDSVINNHTIRFANDGAVRDSFRIFSATKRIFVSAPDGRRTAIVDPRLESRPVLAPDGTVWTYSVANLRFEHHAPDGRSIQLLGLALDEKPGVIMTVAQADSVVAATMAAIPAVRARTHTTMPPAIPPRSITTLSIATSGDLWLMRLVPAPRWDTITVSKQHLAPDEAPLEETVAPNDDDRRYHTIVDVIEPGTARLLARVELPFKGIEIGPGFIGRVRQHRDGHYIVTVYSLRLTKPPA